MQRKADLADRKRELGIYVHIPFCVRKCLYCDFCSMPAEDDIKFSYVNKLLREIDSTEEKYAADLSQYQIRTVYIGGGTPSVLYADYIKLILCKLIDKFLIRLLDRENRQRWFSNKEQYSDYVNQNHIKQELEITIEVNPGTVTREKLRAYRDIGINRLSIGLQSANDEELKRLGRIHTWRDFLNCYEMAGEAGFENINVDIMTALPGQTKESLANTLCKLIELKPGHISAYSLILEEGTVYYELFADQSEEQREIRDNMVDIKQRLENFSLPGEEEEREMYAFVRDTLKAAGYRQYEISNFARPGFESRHNTSYWKRISYLGFGLGAASMIGERRLKNTEQLDEYLKTGDTSECFIEDIALTKKDAMEETMFLGLRMTEGVNKRAFYDTFGTKLDALYETEIKKLSADGLIEDTSEYIRLTAKGVDYGNYVFSRFLL
ncbi:MAG: radical SAM family heme chaperone HemW [Lachnospiraceae bacterium]|nr:radical SAM family heme chaperone HemW [Lachnospiraceae bacterium]